MINLLPEVARAKARHEYWRRVAVVAMGIAAVLLLAGAGLLAPAYMAVRAEQETADRSDALALQTVHNPALVSARTDITKTTTLYSAIIQKSAAARPSAVLDLLVTARPAGIVVRQITFADSGKSIAITLGGISATREDVIDYKNALSAIPGVANADFPPSDLAASSTIGFTMTVKYVPPPQSASTSGPVSTLPRTSIMSSVTATSSTKTSASSTAPLVP